VDFCRRNVIELWLRYSLATAATAHAIDDIGRSLFAASAADLSDMRWL
jgi:hypothetical protein